MPAKKKPKSVAATKRKQARDLGLTDMGPGPQVTPKRSKT